MDTDGGHAEYIRVPGDWVVALPHGLTLKEAMILGTAGFTAALSVMKVVKRGVKPEDGPVAITGASGGVGSVAIKILAKLGYEIHAISKSADARDYLLSLGAKRVLLADDFQRSEHRGAHLLEPEYAAVIDAVGGQVLSSLIKKLKYGGIATTCGLVNGIDLDLTIFSFINRGIQVSGIDSVWIPMEKRLPVWRHLATDWKIDFDVSMHTSVHLDEVEHYIHKILNGKMKGRGVVELAPPPTE